MFVKRRPIQISACHLVTWLDGFKTLQTHSHDSGRRPSPISAFRSQSDVEINERSCRGKILRRLLREIHKSLGWKSE